MFGVVALLACVPAVSLGRTLAAPSSDPTAARVAEWARSNHLGFLVTLAEEVSYRISPPQTGGTPDPSLLQQQQTTPRRSRTHSSSSTRTPTRTPPRRAQHSVAPKLLHPPLATIAKPALAGEGVFRTMVSSARGAAVQLAYLRPDTTHTSYLASILVLDQRALRFVQHPGSEEPGSLHLWKQPDYLPPAQRGSLAATFNSGFKLKDSKGGYYADGHTLGSLRTGAASVVTMTDGTLQLGSWNREVRMSSRVVSVRQNLQLLIDNGQIVPDTASNSQSVWGATIAGADYVWRSGLGIDSQGRAISVSGPSLSVDSLATLLRTAGAVRAMELDINPSWVSTMWYSHRSGSTTPHKTLPFKRPADRYFGPSTRDFVAAYLR